MSLPLLFFSTSFLVQADGLFEPRVGQYWIYSIEGKESLRIENRIVASKKIGSKEWFHMIEYGEKFWIRNSDLGQMEAVNLYTKKPEDIEDIIGEEVVREELVFKFPAKKGESWVTLENTLTYEGEISVTVPAGEFECHMYAISYNKTVYSTSCITEGVGVIYSEVWMEDGRTEISRLEEWGIRED